MKNPNSKVGDKEGGGRTQNTGFLPGNGLNSVCMYIDYCSLQDKRHWASYLYMYSYEALSQDHMHW